MNGITRFVLRRSNAIVVFSVLLSIVAGHYTVELYKNLKPDIEELLPVTARSVVDLGEVRRRLRSTDNLGIVVFSDQVEKSREFVTAFAERLKKEPSNVVASVEYKIDRELEFFEKRRPLYMELSDLKRIRDFIRDRIDYEIELYNPINMVISEELPEPKLDFAALESKYARRASSYTRYPRGYYATQDEKIRAVLAYVPAENFGISGAQTLRDAVDRVIAEVDPSAYADDIEIKFTSGAQNMIEEQASLIADLEMSTIIVMVFVTLGLLFYFVSFRATFALLASLLMGTLWTFAFAYFVIGHLNANSAFLAAIVIGNGINFGIIFLARYLELRRSNIDHFRATHHSMMKTSRATWTAALAAGLAYGSLWLTDFRGFNQFGIIGLAGMVLCWISAFTTFPALLTVFDRRRTLVSLKKKSRKQYLAGLMTWVVGRFPGPIWIGSLALSLFCVLLIPRVDGDILESDLSKLRDKVSMTEGSGYNTRYLDEIFGADISPIVLLPRTRADSKKIADKLNKKIDDEGSKSLIASVRSLDDFIPTDQPEKIRVLREIKRLLPPRVLYRLSKDNQERVKGFLQRETFTPVRIRDVPPLILEKFTEQDGSVGKLVLVEPPLGTTTWSGDKLNLFIAGLRQTADSVAPGTPVAGQLPITSDMIAAITRDGPRATAGAFAAVVLLVVVLFRSIRTITLMLSALMLGVLWMAGIIVYFDIKINFLNFIALPITFGIGVDYAVNIYQRYQSEGGRQILKVLMHTGGAVGLASYTTVIGYGSLILATNQGFVSFGILAVLGEITCILAAMFTIPAFLCYLHADEEALSKVALRRLIDWIPQRPSLRSFRRDDRS